MRERMVERGIAADALQPEWCHQNEALCYMRKTSEAESEEGGEAASEEASDHN